MTANKPSTDALYPDGSVTSSSTTTTTTTTSTRTGSILSTSSSSTRNKSVSFDEINIREFPVTIGDHPGSNRASGPPITIEWKPHSARTLSVDAYEQEQEALTAQNGRARGKEKELILSGELRTSMLQSRNHSLPDIRRAAARAHQERTNRASATVASDFEPITIAAQSARRKVQRWLGRWSGRPLEPAEQWMMNHNVGKDKTGTEQQPAVVGS